MPVLEMLRELTQVPGTSGNEAKAASLAAKYLKPYCESVEYDKLGNLIAVVRKPQPGEEHLLLDAHIDQIGLVVTYIEENGFLRVAASGGIDIRLLCASEVMVHGRKDILGVICSTPPHLQQGEAKNLSCEEIYIDTGYTKDQLAGLVQPGDTVTFCSRFEQLLGTKVKSGALDDRCGCAALIRSAELLQGKELCCGLTILLSTREELGCQGSKTGSFLIAPTQAIAVDVSFGDTPDTPKQKCGKLGQGPMIGISPVLDRSFSESLQELAKKNSIPYQVEVMGGSTSTNADNIAVSRDGVRTALLSVPLRYMHTPIEVIDTEDVEETARLMAAYCMEVGKDA